MQFGSNGSLPEEAAAAYDAVWTAALALHATEEELADIASSTNFTSSIADFTYNDTNVTQRFYSNCLQVSFSGASVSCTYSVPPAHKLIITVQRKCMHSQF